MKIIIKVLLLIGVLLFVYGVFADRGLVSLCGVITTAATFVADGFLRGRKKPVGSPIVTANPFNADSRQAAIDFAKRLHERASKPSTIVNPDKIRVRSGSVVVFSHNGSGLVRGKVGRVNNKKGKFDATIDGGQVVSAQIKDVKQVLRAY